MSYIDAGYVVILGIVAGYALLLLRRRRRAEQVAARLAGRPGPS